MKLNILNINKNEGIKFSKFTGDNNKIHVNEATGNNSIYGENIVHGVLVILRFLEKVNFRKKNSYIKIFFKEGFKYDHDITFKKKFSKSKIFYNLYQQNNINAKIELGNILLNSPKKKLSNESFKKKYFASIKKSKVFKFKNIESELVEALCNLTKYVGTVYPGKNSLISEVIIFNTGKDQNNNILITSDDSLIKKGFPIIANELIYKNYNIQFKTLVRPQLEIKLKKPAKKILNEVNLIKKNIFIIGASSGIGNDLLEIFLNNKKIKVIATYFKNKIKKKRKNLILKKINIETDLHMIFKIIKKYHPCYVYYFATPKILFRTISNKKIIKSYNNYFVKWPIRIIKYAKNYNCNFFYPSTTYSNKSTLYFITKSKAEKEINKLKNNKISIVKMPGINTRQSLSLIHKKLPNLRDLMERDNKIFNKVFFRR